MLRQMLTILYSAVSHHLCRHFFIHVIAIIQSTSLAEELNAANPDVCIVQIPDIFPRIRCIGVGELWRALRFQQDSSEAEGSEEG